MSIEFRLSEKIQKRKVSGGRLETRLAKPRPSVRATSEGSTTTTTCLPFAILLQLIVVLEVTINLCCITFTSIQRSRSVSQIRTTFHSSITSWASSVDTKKRSEAGTPSPPIRTLYTTTDLLVAPSSITQSFSNHHSSGDRTPPRKRRITHQEPVEAPVDHSGSKFSTINSPINPR